jgi:MFS family permease
VIHGPISMALATTISPTEIRGRYLAAFQYSFTAAGIITPTFFTTLFNIHRALPWAVLGTVNCLGIIAMRLLERSLPPSTQHDVTKHSHVTGKSSTLN